MEPMRIPIAVQSGIMGIIPLAESSSAESNFLGVSLLSFLIKLTTI
ncbi:unnamed protein product, partial [marine sediment metagenome]